MIKLLETFSKNVALINAYDKDENLFPQITKIDFKNN